MKRPPEADAWTWEYPGYWSFTNEIHNMTIGDCGVQINLADRSENLDTLGDDSDPFNFHVVVLHQIMQMRDLEGQFLAVVYLILDGTKELEARGTQRMSLS